jgi:hypothetical protein
VNECKLDRESIKKFYWNLINLVCSIPTTMKLDDESFHYRRITEIFATLDQWKASLK